MFKLVGFMCMPSPRIADGLANFFRHPAFRRRPVYETLRQQLLALCLLLRLYGVKIFLEENGQQFPDSTFVFDHAALVRVKGKLLAFLPCLNWPRRLELQLTLSVIGRIAELIQPPVEYGGKPLRFDPGTVVQSPNGIAIGYSRSKSARTNIVGARWMAAILKERGYEGKIALVEYIGLHLSSFCTCIASKGKPESVFLVAPKYVRPKGLTALKTLGTIIEVDDDEAWRANTIAHPLLDRVILMKRWLSGPDLLKRKLKALGYKIVELKFTESPCVQGSPACHLLSAPLTLEEICRIFG